MRATNGRGRDVPQAKVADIVAKIKTWEETQLAEAQDMFEEKVRNELNNHVKTSFSDQEAIQNQIDETMKHYAKNPK